MQGTVKKTLQGSKETSNEVLVQVKKNQPKLFKKLEKYVLTESAIDSLEAQEKQKNRIEKRKIETFAPPQWIHSTQWNPIRTVIAVQRETERLDTKTKKWQWSYELTIYLATCRLTANDSAQFIRNHWWIENKNHRVRDGALLEDDSRIRKNPQTMAILRSFALNLMRYNQVENIANETYKKRNRYQQD